MRIEVQTPERVDAGSIENIASRLLRFAEATPDKAAIIAPAKQSRAGTMTYSHTTFLQLNEESDRYAHGLSTLGINESSKVLLMVPPGVEFVALWFALLKIGACVILIDPGMGGKNLRSCIKTVEPDALIAIPAVFGIKSVFPDTFSKIKHSVIVGRKLLFRSPTLSEIRLKKHVPFTPRLVEADDPSAIVFTTGSTGVPKGVVYTQELLKAQIDSIEKHFSITPEDIGFPAFLPFSLFCIVMGTTAVMPKMNPSKPAKADPAQMVELLENYRCSYSFGSPAFWTVVSDYCIANKIELPEMKNIMMFGAPVRERVLRNLNHILPNGESHTPYGATEALPVSSISGTELITHALKKTKQGHGVCIGKPLSHARVKVIEISDAAIANIEEAKEVKPGEIGEIIVQSDVVSKEYFNRDDQTKLAKIKDGSSLWHRMGDLGYFDDSKTLWFCGRKNHRVKTSSGDLYTVPCEAIFNQHPEVERSALVGVPSRSGELPVIIIEAKDVIETKEEKERLSRELFRIAKDNPSTAQIKHLLFHPSFPVDFRHNAKIIRETLAAWARESIRA